MSMLTQLEMQICGTGNKLPDKTSWPISTTRRRGSRSTILWCRHHCRRSQRRRLRLRLLRRRRRRLRTLRRRRRGLRTLRHRRRLRTSFLILLSLGKQELRPFAQPDQPHPRLHPRLHVQLHRSQKDTGFSTPSYFTTLSRRSFLSIAINQTCTTHYLPYYYKRKT